MQTATATHERLPAFQILTYRSVPFYKELVPSLKSWVPAFLEWEKFQDSLKDLEEQRREAETSMITRAELLKRLRLSFEQAEQRRLEVLQAHLREYRNPTTSTDPFDIDRLLGSMGRVSEMFIPPFSWDQVEKAVAALPEGLSEKDRAKELSDLYGQLLKIRAEIERLEPRDRFDWAGMNRVRDRWQLFTKHWRTLQYRCVAPCDPRGLSLTKDSDPNLFWTWGQLIGFQYVNEKGRFRPAPLD